MSQLSQPGELPVVVESKLRAVRQRMFAMRATDGVILTMAVLVAVMMAAMLVDWLIVLFDPRWRTTITLVSLLAAVVTFVLSCVRPLVHRRLLSSVARRIDQAVPSLEERWSTVTELAESPDPPAIRGAPHLIRQVAREAADLDPLVQAPKVVSKSDLRRHSVVLGAALGILLLVFAVAPTRTGTLLQRFWAPASDISMTRISSLTGNRVVPRKEPLTLQANMEGLDHDSAILFIRGGEDEGRVPLSRLADPDSDVSFQYKLRSVEDSFRYRFRTGDGQSAWHQITAVDRPSLAEVRFRIVPPAYTRLPDEDLDALPRKHRALQGSRLELAFRSARPLSRMELVFGEDRSETLTPVEEEDCYGYETTLEESIFFAVRLVDEHDLTNLSPPSCRIKVVPDRPPTVEITSPEEEVVIPPDEEKITIEFAARDDIGIDQAELIVTVGDGQDGEEVEVIPIPLDDQQGAKEVHTQVELDLKPFNLEHGAELSYAVRVADGRLATAMSEPSRPDETPFDPKEALADASDQQRDEQMQAQDASQSDGKNDSQPGSAKADDGQQTESDSTTGDQQADSQKNDGSQQASDSQQQPGSQQKDSSQQASDPQQQPGSQQDTDPQQDSDPQRKSGSQRDAGSQGDQDQSSEQDKSAQAKSSQSDTPPPNNMTKRPLPGTGTASSKMHTIKVDKWAGEFAGQARKKLRLEIDRFLERLDAALAAAETTANGLIKHIRGENEWTGQQKRELGGGREKLAEADEVIFELRGKSADTPYAFIGLQLEDIGQAHVTPARKHLAGASNTDQDQSARRLDELEQGSYHIARAREKLAALTRKYEAVKRQEQLAEAMERFAKMHQIFVEDMHAFLKSKKPRLNPRAPRGKLEVDEEYAKALQEYHEQLKKMMAELSKLLAEDPDLLRRYMAMMRLEGITIRDQLTILAQRHQRLQKELGDWLDAGEAGRPAMEVRLAQALLDEQREIVELAAQLHDNTITWMPRDADDSQGPLAEIQTLAEAAARFSYSAARSLAEGDQLASLEAANEVAARLQGFHKEIAKAIPEDEEPSAKEGEEGEESKLAIFVANRMSESEKLLARQSGWIEKVQAVQKKRFGRAASIDQDRLRWDTAEFGTKLERVVAMVDGFSDEIRQKSRELERAVSEEVVTDQSETSLALKTERLRRARERGAKTIESFARTEGLFDELLTLIEEALPAGGMLAGGPEMPKLENLLAMLEKECKACEKLGLAPLRMNIMVQSDWAMPGEGSGAGGGGEGSGGKAQGQGDPSKAKPQPADYQPGKTAEAQARAARKYADQVAKEMEKAREQAQARADKMAQAEWDRDPAAGPDGEDDPAGPFDGKDQRDWNVLSSKLQRELRQVRANTPPEEYRRAVDEYFRRMSEELATAAGTP